MLCYMQAMLISLDLVLLWLLSLTFFFIFNSAEETEMVAVNGLGWVLKTGKHLGFPVGTRGYSHHVLCQAMQCS